MLLSTELAASGRVRVYRSATVIDGTGVARYPADVAVEGARIVAIIRTGDAPLDELPADTVTVDATGLVLAPGFIDMHAHSDLAVLTGAEHQAKIRQGVTTEVIGQDGLGYAPLDEAAAAVIPAQIAGWNGPTDAPWRTVDDLLDAIDSATAANLAVLVPQGNLRMMTVGHENRVASEQEIDAMCVLLGDALDAGAFGMSSGLTYTPGMYASTAELETLCRVVAERGGYWAPHTRSYGRGALDAFREALDIGRRTGCPIHLTHATMNFAPNRGRASELLSLIDDAIADGVDVTLDTYPYLPGATTLASLLPSRPAGDGILIGAKPHPRGSGTFPRYLGHYVRELGILSLEEAVQHLSATPARRLGLDRGDAPRGVIREGATADLVLFDPELIAAGATFDDPRAHPVGIAEVLVAGVPVVTGGDVTGATPGRALRMTPAPHRATVPLMKSTIDPQAAPFVLCAGAAIIAPDELVGIATILRENLALEDAIDPDAPQIVLRIDDSLGNEEAFRIDVTAERIELAGAAPVGVFRAATTLRQLCTPGPAELPSGSQRIPAGRWEGAPAYGWRGAMLDVARHFRPTQDIRRLIDLLAMHHLNVLHLHLTDDQGWRFEVPGYPRLTEIGARREATQRGHGPRATVEPGVHEGFYTTVELQELVAYAAERFVTLVPEVELPGHVQAALAAYPELGNIDVGDPPTAAWERFGVNPRVLAPTDEALAFGRAAIDALCDVFDSPWIGIGGDEVPVTEWAQSPAASERMRELGLAAPHDVQPWFTSRFVEHVRSRGRTALAWDEVLEGDVPDDVAILAWRGPVAMAEALRRGIPVIGCPDLHTYLDYRQSDSGDEPVPVGPPLTIEGAYALSLPDGVVGGQANTWTEHLPTRDRVDFAMFPRLVAIAERLWAGGATGDLEGFLRRLPVQLRRLSAAGVEYRQLDGPIPAQRRAGIPGKPISIADREQIVAELVEELRLAQNPVRKVN